MPEEKKSKGRKDTATSPEVAGGSDTTVSLEKDLITDATALTSSETASSTPDVPVASVSTATDVDLTPPPVASAEFPADPKPPSVNDAEADAIASITEMETSGLADASGADSSEVVVSNAVEVKFVDALLDMDRALWRFVHIENSYPSMGSLLVARARSLSNELKNFRKFVLEHGYAKN